MNNNAYQYYKPFYLTDFNPIYPLKNAGDSSVMFFEVKYRIRPESYVSRTKGGTEFPPLTDIIAYNGKNIIPSWIDKSKYRLLEEKIEFDKFYNTITETYGFTPSESRTENKTITAWVRPAFAKRKVGGYLNFAVDSFSYDETTQQHTLNFTSNIHTANIGDTIKIISSDYEYTEEGVEESDKWRYQEAEVFVRDTTDTSIILDVFSFKIKRSSDNMQLLDCMSNDESLSAFFIDDIKFTVSIPTETKTIYSGIGVDNQDGLYKFSIAEDSNVADVGDVVQFMNGGVIGSAIISVDRWLSSDVVVVDKDNEFIYVQDFDIMFYDKYSQPSISYKYSELTRWESKLTYVKKVAISPRNAYSGDFIGTAVVEYKHLSEVKNLQQAWKPILGLNYTDTISGGSQPNFEQYDEMVKNRTKVLAQPQSAERFIGDIYKITSIYIEAQ